MLMSVEEAARRIRSGEALMFSGDAENLALLPRGNWIGGTMPYCMTTEGGRACGQGVWATSLPPEVRLAQVETYGVEDLAQVVADAPEHGFSLLILPAGSDVHLHYAHHAPDFPQMFTRPILGWVSGVRLDAPRTVSPQVVDGLTGTFHDRRAVVLHCTLDPGVAARIGILNLFHPGDGDIITFPEDSFQAREAWINGRRKPFAAYLAEQGADIRLPLVANYCGAMVNVSFREVDQDTGLVSFFAPVFQGVAYRLAAPVGDYVAAFERVIPQGPRPIFSCNCILNYLFGGLEGRATLGMEGPITFGEIAYQLLNQTLVYLTLERDA